MALTARLEMKQGQSLVMTPQLQQAIKLLQLSNLELSAYIEAELEKNPLLALESGYSEIQNQDGSTPSSSKDEQPENQSPSDDPMLTATDTQLTEPNNSSDLDTDFENIVPDATVASTSYADELKSMNNAGSKTSQGSVHNSESAPNIEAYLCEERSLHDHLEDQLHMSLSNTVQLTIAHNLIDIVDEAGYLVGSLDEVAIRLGVDIALVEKTLSILQTFEPSGVFARSVSECLTLQMKDKGELTEQYKIFLDHIDLLASHKFTKLKKLCQTDEEGFKEMIAMIRTLNPKPGLQYGSVMVQPVTPDVIVTARADGSWHIELNSENLPRVLIDQSYYSVISKSKKTANDRQFLNNCLQTANWLVKSLDQRAKTIMKVSEEIIRHQDAFFLHGVEHLKPLNLKTIAEAIGMHESTVSRATAGKYMATSRGLFELRYFFTSSIPSANIENNHSSEAVRFKIRKMIDEEAANTVLSDDRIVTLLKAENIDIARRTVAKYRELMRIPSSVQRRREKKMAMQAV